MIYPPGYDPSARYQEVEHDGRRFAVIQGTVAEMEERFRLALGDDVFTVLRDIPLISEAEWMAEKEVRDGD